MIRGDTALRDAVENDLNRRGEADQALREHAEEELWERGDNRDGRLQELRAEWAERAGQPRADSVTRRIIGILPAHPILTPESVAHALDVDPRVARRGIAVLHDAGVLHPVDDKRARGRTWIADDAFDALDEFDAAVARDAGNRKIGPTRHLRKRTSSSPKSSS